MAPTLRSGGSRAVAGPPGRCPVAPRARRPGFGAGCGRTASGLGGSSLSWPASCSPLLAHPAVAPAKRGLVTGFADGARNESSDPTERATWLDRTLEARAGIVRLDLSWRGIAASQRPLDPTNPGSASYDFSRIDAAVRDAEARGLVVLLLINSAPAWAEAPGRPPSAEPGTWKPSPSDLADFMRAVAARYSGGFDPDGPGPAPPLPAVQALQVPGLSPTSTPAQSAIRGADSLQPRPLPRDAQRRLLGGEGGGPEDARGHRRTLAIWWFPRRQSSPARPVLPRAALRARGEEEEGEEEERRLEAGVRENAKLPRPGEVRRSRPQPDQHQRGGGAVGHQSGRRLQRQTWIGSCACCAAPRPLERCCPGGIRSGRRRAGGTATRRTPWAPRSGLQARWTEQAMYLAWQDGASVFINLLIRDFGTGPYDAHGALDSGIFFADGQPKPAYTAFRFPFVTERIDKRRLRAWGKAPAGGQAGDPARAPRTLAGGEEDQGEPGRGLRRKAPAAREAAVARGGRGQPKPGLETGLISQRMAPSSTAARRSSGSRSSSAPGDEVHTRCHRASRIEGA